MHRVRMVLAAAALALAATALLSSGCSRQSAKQVTAPKHQLTLDDFKTAHWITDPGELRTAMARARQSPLVVRAVLDRAADPRLSLLESGVLSGVATGPDGSALRFTILPYQYVDDPDRAVYFALIESNGKTRVESFDLLRGKPSPSESDFQPINGAAHGIWMRGGPVYVPGRGGIVTLAPEKINPQKFGACFIPGADRAIDAVHDGCAAMGDFPGCVSIGSGLALAATAAYCAFMAWE